MNRYRRPSRASAHSAVRVSQSADSSTFGRRSALGAASPWRCNCAVLGSSGRSWLGSVGVGAGAGGGRGGWGWGRGGGELGGSRAGAAGGRLGVVLVRVRFLLMF